MTRGAAERLIHASAIALAAVLATAAIIVHVPGHVSMDSSEQLYEAVTGRSVTWSPPLMSALLRVLGGGLQATTIVVVASAVLTYGGAVLALLAARRHSERGMGWRVLPVALLIANPVIFLYVGIVWKDVLLAALLAASSGLLLLGWRQQGRARLVAGAAALVLLAPMLLVRQQGIILAPPLAVAAAVLLAGPRGSWPDARWWGRWAGVLIAYALLCVALAAGTRNLIQGTDDKSTAVGFAAIQRYDLTGMLASGSPPLETLPPPLAEPDFLAAVRRTYTADRIDFVLNDPRVVEGFRTLRADDVARAFRAQVRARPWVYLQVKSRQFAWLLDVHRLDRCLPLHVGVEGNPEYLRAAGMSPRATPRDHQLYLAGLWSRHLVFYRHWFYLAGLVLASVYLAVRWRRGNLPGAPVAAALASGLLAFYGAYAVTTIACDFRYLYPGLVGTSILAIYLLAVGPGSPARSRETAA